MTTADERPIFLLRLRPLKGTDPIRALRWILKRVLRDHKMQALSVEEEKPQ
jgi:hypothetical protein